MSGLGLHAKSELINKIARKILELHGYPEPPPGTYDLEWDLGVEDSQLSIVYEDVSNVFSLIYEYGCEVGKAGSVSAPSHATYTYNFSQPPLYKLDEDRSNLTFSSNSVRSLLPKGLSASTKIRISLGTDSNLSDLKSFVEKLEVLEVSDDTEIESLVYEIQISDCDVERISCGECGYDDYLVRPPDHECIVP